MKLKFRDLPPLQEMCDCTEGDVKGERIYLDEDSGEWLVCRRCNKATGMRPTKFGLAVLGLVNDHGGYVRESVLDGI